MKDKFTVEIVDGIEMKVPIININKKQVKLTARIKKYFPKFFEYINSLYPTLDTWEEKIYLYLHGLIEPPKCVNPKCHNKQKFIGFTRGYQKYCCHKCSVEDPIPRIKQEITCMKLYGVKNVFQSELFKEKIKETNLTKFGVENPMQVKEIVEKGKLTKLKNQEIRGYSGCEKSVQTRKKHMIEKVDDLIGYAENGLWIVTCPHTNEYPFNEICKNCSHCFLIDSHILKYRKKHNLETCTNLAPVGGYSSYMPNNSSFENKICDFLSNQKIKFEKHVRNFIKINNQPRELDILISESNLAIEINGNYWHSLKEKEPNYHIEKFIACRDKGIELISIWEDWFNDLELLKEFILDALNHNDKTKYKKIWFPDLDDSQWPNDLGFYNNNLPEIINPHKIFHGNFECYDSGITII